MPEPIAEVATKPPVNALDMAIAVQELQDKLNEIIRTLNELIASNNTNA